MFQKEGESKKRQKYERENKRQIALESCSNWRVKAA